MSDAKLPGPVGAPVRTRPVPPVKMGLLKAFFTFLRDPEAPVLGKLFVFAVLAYVVFPIDLVPDFPIVGWIDDAGFAALAVWYLSGALEKYRSPPEVGAAASTEALPVHRGR